MSLFVLWNVSQRVSSGFFSCSYWFYILVATVILSIVTATLMLMNFKEVSNLKSHETELNPCSTNTWTLNLSKVQVNSASSWTCAAEDRQSSWLEKRCYLCTVLTGRYWSATRSATDEWGSRWYEFSSLQKPLKCFQCCYLCFDAVIITSRQNYTVNDNAAEI